MPPRRRVSPFLEPIFGAHIHALLPDDGAGAGDQGGGAGGGGPKPPADAGPAGGEAGLKRDLQDERQRRRTAEQERDALKAEKDKADQEKLTETERAAQRAEQAERERDTARGELDRMRAAQKAGLGLEWADRLRGSTAEELEADAKALKETLGGGAGQAGGAGPAGGQSGTQGGTGAPRTPAPDPSQGARTPVPGGTFESGAERARRRYPQQQGSTTA